LARLYVDARFREEFVADPGKVALRAGLSAEECEAAIGIGVDELFLFAKSLQAKKSQT
jgi:hypothetical protein